METMATGLPAVATATCGMKDVINEGVNLARRFGAIDGHKYINACLDAGAQSLRATEIGG